MSRVTLVDTGPLVAFLSADDGNHKWAVETFATTRSPVKTCEAVISEACFLVGRNRHAASTVLEFLAAAEVEIVSLSSEHGVLAKLMKKYASVPMSYADACLLRMSELYSDCVVLTTDSDFHIYRRSGRRVVKALSPY